MYLQVSLLAKEAVVQYVKSGITPEKLAEVISKMSFPSHVKRATYQDAVLFIDGMTCMSCVRNIEGSVSVQNGVKFIRVSLGKKLGYVKFDPTAVSANDIRDSVDEMGFVASLTPPGENNGNLPDKANAYIEVSIYFCIISTIKQKLITVVKLFSI